MDEFNTWNNSEEFEINVDTKLYLLTELTHVMKMLNGALFKNSIPVSKGEILYHDDYIFYHLN